MTQPKAWLDFRVQLTAEIDAVLSARAKALNLDKAAIARDVLEKWAATERRFCDLITAEDQRNSERMMLMRIQRQPLRQRTKNAVFARDGRTCKECGAQPAIIDLHIDHIIPVSAGGTNDLANLRLLCKDCNLSKGAKVVAIDGGRAK